MSGSGLPEEEPSRAPYGPATAEIRRFLVRLAALDPAARTAVVERFSAVAGSRSFLLADSALAETIERSGRSDAQEALAGPLLQLVGRRAEGDVNSSDQGNDADGVALDEIAEPALAAVLALMVRDLLPAMHFRTLYGAFDLAIPVQRLTDAT